MAKLVVLCFPISEMGHTNATLGFATALAKRGHRIVFATERSWQGKFLQHGFEEEVYDEKDKAEESSGKQWSEMFNQMVEMLKMSPIQKLSFMPMTAPKFIGAANYFHRRLEEIIATVKPDVIIEDHVVITPALLMAKAPVVKLFSGAPLMLFNDERLPPFGLGLPLDDPSSWEEGRKVLNEANEKLMALLNEFLHSIDPNVPKVGARGFHKATNLTIYVYPKTLVEDYLRIIRPDDTLCRIDHCLRKSEGNFEIPEKLKRLPGKLIYVSLGSWVSSIVELMKHLIDILSKSKHKFVIAQGHNHDKYELPETMWGQEFVPQLNVLPVVDLVITHGGNNSFTETLYFGKPMIVLPLVGDQYENAQRVEELGIGKKFNPFAVDGSELLEAIEVLLSDSNVKEKLQKISKEMQASDEMEKAIDRIEYTAKHPKSPNYF